MGIPIPPPLGALVSLSGYSGRKIGLVVGLSASGKVRIRTWRHNSRQWTLVQSFARSQVEGYAPAEWPQTRAAKRSDDYTDIVRAIHLATLGRK